VKFLVDAQLPFSLAKLLNEQGFDTIHTYNLPDRNKTTDQNICNLAKEQQRIIISKDKDFLDSHLIKRIPEKIIIVRTGNISNQVLLELFRVNISSIIQMLERSSLIEINQLEIIEHQ
jgi:predicted nuclease of predicted toxin-antitoxin system